MSKLEQQKKLIRQIIKQLSGEIDEEIDLVPECGIESNKNGYIFCFQPESRSFVKIYTNQNVYILDEYEKENKLLIYTTCGRLVHIDADIVYQKEFN
tara:strand:- start:430 stop:720 length:291 start_codon:yes stop_codon:yes gene_type:complete